MRVRILFNASCLLRGTCLLWSRCSCSKAWLRWSQARASFKMCWSGIGSNWSNCSHIRGSAKGWSRCWHCWANVSAVSVSTCKQTKTSFVSSNLASTVTIGPNSSSHRLNTFKSKSRCRRRCRQCRRGFKLRLSRDLMRVAAVLAVLLSRCRGICKQSYRVWG